MRLLVPVKRVVDYAVKVRLNSAKNAIDSANVKHSMNPFCEIATEAAVQLKDKKIAQEVIAISIGPQQAVDTLRTALAMGADRAIHVLTSMRTDTELQPLAVANILKSFVEKEKIDAVILGKQSIDDDSNQTGQMLAGKLQWPAATFASKIEVSEDKKFLTVTCEVDGGLQVVKMPLPAIVTTDLRLNTPRFATLPNIMKAKKKQLETVKIEDVGVPFEPRFTVISVAEPPARSGGKKVESVDELIEKLRSVSKVI